MCVIRKFSVLVYQQFENGEGLVGNGFVLLFPDGTTSVKIHDFCGNELSTREFRLAVQDEASVHPYPSHPKALPRGLQ